MSPAIDAEIQTIVPIVNAVTFPDKSVQPISLKIRGYLAYLMVLTLRMGLNGF